MTSLQSFSDKEKVAAKQLLATTVALMMGRKFEEGDWSSIYCRAKNIPEQNWSNVHIDIMHNGLGVEHKMLGMAEGRSLLSYAGTTLMHPSATRSIRIDSTDMDADAAMRSVFSQYSELIESRTKRVATHCNVEAPDMRIGWLIWERSLTEFLYFEERMESPRPELYRACWQENSAKGSRKATRNLWIYEKSTGKKRYSVTTSAGIKIQPYFDVPSYGDPNLVYFRVQGEALDNDLVRIWLSATTARELRLALGLKITDPIDTARLSDAIIEASANVAEVEAGHLIVNDLAEAFEIRRDAYIVLLNSWEGVSDEHRAQLLLHTLRSQ